MWHGIRVKNICHVGSNFSVVIQVNPVQAFTEVFSFSTIGRTTKIRGTLAALKNSTPLSNKGRSIKASHVSPYVDNIHRPNKNKNWRVVMMQKIGNWPSCFLLHNLRSISKNSKIAATQIQIKCECIWVKVLLFCKFFFILFFFQIQF